MEQSQQAGFQRQLPCSSRQQPQAAGSRHPVPPKAGCLRPVARLGALVGPIGDTVQVTIQLGRSEGGPSLRCRIRWHLRI